eukprot:1679728-Pleurochrysis_carterae.AAC.1
MSKVEALRAIGASENPRGVSLVSTCSGTQLNSQPAVRGQSEAVQFLSSRNCRGAPPRQDIGLQEYMLSCSCS